MSSQKCFKCQTIYDVDECPNCQEKEAKEMKDDNRFKMLEGRIDTMQTLAVECIEFIYNAGYNEAIEAAANLVNSHENYDVVGAALTDMIKELKK
jgi:hypothetical protein